MPHQQGLHIKPIIYCDKIKNGTKIRYHPHIVASGRNAGRYQLHKRRERKRNMIKHARFVSTLEEVAELIRTGEWCLRMSPKQGVSASIIEPSIITITDSPAPLHSHIANQVTSDQLDADDAYEAQEWREKLVIHRQHERDRTIVGKKKVSAQNLRCECCDFDFFATYGKLGDGFIECHHRQPLAMIEEGMETRLKDLALVCANCHRILHRSKTALSVEGLREIVKQQRVSQIIRPCGICGCESFISDAGGKCRRKSCGHRFNDHH